EPRDFLVVPVAPYVVVEPQAVFDDRTAEREVGVPVLDQAGHLRQPEPDQLVIQVVALRPFAREAEEACATEGVAARFRDQVEGGATAIDLAESAGDRHLDLGRFADRIAETGDAAAVEGRPDVHAVDLDRTFIASASSGGEEVRRDAGT